MKYIKDKHGFLLGEETLKILIAVICIIFLVFLLVSLYYNMTGAQKSKEAISSIELISGKITSVNNGVEEPDFLIPNPAGWFLFSFTGETPKPNACVGENCLCICRKVLVNNLPLLNLNKQAKECDKKGICAKVSNLNEFEKIKIENDGTFIAIVKINEQISVNKR